MRAAATANDAHKLRAMMDARLPDQQLLQRLLGVACAHDSHHVVEELVAYVATARGFDADFDGESRLKLFVDGGEKRDEAQLSPVATAVRAGAARAAQVLLNYGAFVDAVDVEGMPSSVRFAAPRANEREGPAAYDVVIVGAGAAGIGVAAALKQCGAWSVLVVDRHDVGASFERWPKHTRFITPSFHSGAFGAPDLNAVDPSTSLVAGPCASSEGDGRLSASAAAEGGAAPARKRARRAEVSGGEEHPCGVAYAAYLRRVVERFGIAVWSRVDVRACVREDKRHGCVAAEASAETTPSLRGSIGPFLITGSRRVGGDDRTSAAVPLRLRARYVVWAGGEYSFPNGDAVGAALEGASEPTPGLSLHSSSVAEGAAVVAPLQALLAARPTDAGCRLGGGSPPPQDAVVVVGASESGVDVAVSLIDAGAARVVLCDGAAPWRVAGLGEPAAAEAPSNDPSCRLSPRTIERLRAAYATARLELVASRVVALAGSRCDVRVALATGRVVRSAAPAILATGFDPGHGSGLAASLFEWSGMRPLLSEHDESCRTPGVFMCGPSVRHCVSRAGPGKANTDPPVELIFCFVYKFRNRFAIVARTILERLEVAADAAAGSSGGDYPFDPLERRAMLQAYARAGMLCDDLRGLAERQCAPGGAC